MSLPAGPSSVSQPQPTTPDPNFQLAWLAAIVESSDDAIVSKTLEGRILSWNQGARQIFGYQAEEAVGQPVTMIIPPELHHEEQQILEKLKRGERIEHFDTTRVAKNGRRIPISLTVSPIRDANGLIIGASKIARDISDRQAAEQALLDADRRKDEFLALLAHELRNPLAPIRHALAASRRASTPEQYKRAEQVIERQTAHMSRLLEDLLDISRITRGKLTIKKVTTDLNAVLETAIETARPLINSKQHHLSVNLPNQPVHFNADPVRLAQVFANILINAAKYTNPEGLISVRATLAETELTVSVQDNGIGIPEELMPRLFDIYSQGREASGRDEGGLGIGLSLVRGLVDLHGGTIEAISAGTGRGSEFIVRLPINQPATAGHAETVTATERLTRLKVLIVDDNKDAADMYGALLELSGHSVRTAYTGRQALEVAKAFLPDAILTDIGLPDVNGYELARQVRASAWGADILLVAVTGWGQDGDKQRAFSAGFNHHLTKPIEADSMESVLNSARPIGRR